MHTIQSAVVAVSFARTWAHLSWMCWISIFVGCIKMVLKIMEVNWQSYCLTLKNKLSSEKRLHLDPTSGIKESSIDKFFINKNVFSKKKTSGIKETSFVHMKHKMNANYDLYAVLWKSVVYPINRPMYRQIHCFRSYWAGSLDYAV